MQEAINLAALTVTCTTNFLNAVCTFVQGPTISPVFCKRDGRVSADYFAIVICVPKKDLYKSVKQLRAVRLSFQALFLFLLLC